VGTMRMWMKSCVSMVRSGDFGDGDGDQHVMVMVVMVVVVVMMAIVCV